MEKQEMVKFLRTEMEETLNELFVQVKHESELAETVMIKMNPEDRMDALKPLKVQNELVHSLLMKYIDIAKGLNVYQEEDEETTEYIAKIEKQMDDVFDFRERVLDKFGKFQEKLHNSVACG